MHQTSRPMSTRTPPVSSRPVANGWAPPSRAWFVMLALGSVVLLAALVTGSVYLVSKLPRRPDLAAEKANPPAAPAQPVPDGKSPKPSEAASPSVRPAEQPKAEPQAGANEERFMSALGSLTAAHHYQSYLNLGLLADAWEKDVYEEEEAMKMLATVQGMIDGVDRQLVRLEKASVKEDDRKALARSRELGALLKTQAKELAAYWEGGAKEHADAFHKARETAWASLKELLKIEE
jgi:hypothetical protein